jgi:hypothetical protein
MLEFKLTNFYKNTIKYFIIGLIFNFLLLISLFVEISIYFEPILNFNYLYDVVIIIVDD